jgi:Domain of unknown function (DUF4192)
MCLTDAGGMSDLRPREPRGPRKTSQHSSSSHSSAKHSSSQHSPAALRSRVRVGSADDILAVIPHLLGFNPADSLVVLGVGGAHARIRLAFRYDIPDPLPDGVAAEIAEHAAMVLRRQDLPLAVLIGYGPGQTVTPVVDAVAPAIMAAGVAVHDALRAHEGRYWSYVCGDPAHCPPEGVPFDPSAHPAAAALAAAGLTVVGDRADLAATIAPITELAEPMRRAVSGARRRAGQLIEEAIAAGQVRDVYQPIADAGRKSVRLAVASYRRGGELTDHDEIAWLGFALTDLRVRDDAWARMDPAFSAAHIRMWTDLIRRLPPELRPAPAALLAFTAWQAGDGALASIAIERALESDPHYSMALLVAEALQAGLPPSAARLPMTPKQVAASYARCRTA